jgi:hypothetical protein
MKNNKYIVLVILLTASSAIYAQPGFDPGIEDTAPIPGIFLAIAAAIGIGVAKYKVKK